MIIAIAIYANHAVNAVNTVNAIVVLVVVLRIRRFVNLHGQPSAIAVNVFFVVIVVIVVIIICPVCIAVAVHASAGALVLRWWWRAVVVVVVVLPLGGGPRVTVLLPEVFHLCQRRRLAVLKTRRQHFEAKQAMSFSGHGWEIFFPGSIVGLCPRLLLLPPYLFA
jgi:hypothetical protein